MPLHFRCPCGVILNSPDGSAGRAAECPTCGKIIVIPQEAISLALADLEVPGPKEAAAPEPAPEPVPEPEPPVAAPSPAPVFAGVAGFAFQPSSPEPSSAGGAPTPPPEAAEDEIEPAPQALKDDVSEPEQVFGPATGAAPEKGSPSWQLPDKGAASGPTLVTGPGELDVVAISRATPAEGTDIGPPAPDKLPQFKPPEPPKAAASAMPDDMPSTKPARPKSSLRKGPTAARVPRSKTSVARKRGRKALEVLDAVGTGEGADKAKSRRSRRVPLRGIGAKGKILLAFIIVLLLCVGCLAGLLFVPEHLVPEGFRDRLDSLKSTLRELGLPIGPSGGTGESGGGTDAGAEGLAKATGPLPIEK